MNGQNCFADTQFTSAADPDRALKCHTLLPEAWALGLQGTWEMIEDNSLAKTRKWEMARAKARGVGEKRFMMPILRSGWHSIITGRP